MTSRDGQTPAAETNALLQAAASGWDAMLVEDDSVIDADRLSAYAEGRLSAGEAAETERQILASPRAMDIVVALGGTLPAGGADESPPAAPAVQGAAAWPRAAGRRSWQAPLAVAAGLLVAVGVGASLNWFAGASSRLATQNQIARLSAELLDAEKARLAAASPYGPVQLGGRLTPDLIRVARIDGASLRGPQTPTAAERQAIRRAGDRVLAAVQAASGAPRDAAAETAFALINAGRLAEAAAEVEALRAIAEADPAVVPTLKNLEASLLVAEAQDLPMADARASLERAESLFREAGEAGVAPAWLNLASLAAGLGDDETARAAVEAYAAVERDPANAAAARAAWGLPPQDD